MNRSLVGRIGDVKVLIENLMDMYGASSTLGETLADLERVEAMVKKLSPEVNGKKKVGKRTVSKKKVEVVRRPPKRKESEVPVEESRGVELSE